MDNKYTQSVRGDGEGKMKCDSRGSTRGSGAGIVPAGHLAKPVVDRVSSMYIQRVVNCQRNGRIVGDTGVVVSISVTNASAGATRGDPHNVCVAM